MLLDNQELDEYVGKHRGTILIVVSFVFMYVGACLVWVFS